MSQRGMKPLNSLASLPPEIAAEMRSTPLISGLTLDHTASWLLRGSARWTAALVACLCLVWSSGCTFATVLTSLVQSYVYAVSGTLYRESGVVSGITNRRWASLYPHSIATFRKEGTTEPSKVWPLSSRCQLSKIKCKEFMVREKHTSTIWALAAGHYDRKQMVGPLLPVTS